MRYDSYATKAGRPGRLTLVLTLASGEVIRTSPESADAARAYVARCREGRFRAVNRAGGLRAAALYSAASHFGPASRPIAYL